MIMSYCPNCGKEMDDHANFCVKCGAKLADYPIGEKEQTIELPEIIRENGPEIEVEVVKENVPKKSCEICGNGQLIVVDDKGKNLLFRCNSCGFYLGNFMKKGKIIYYNTMHLKIGQYISGQLIHGRYRVSVHKAQRGKELDELADRIREDLQIDKSKIFESLNHLLEKNILYSYYEPTPDGEFEWFGVEFSSNIPGDLENTTEGA
jgi:uncharacterized membrane protein YvbJ